MKARAYAKADRRGRRRAAQPFTAVSGMRVLGKNLK